MCAVSLVSQIKKDICAKYGLDKRCENSLHITLITASRMVDDLDEKFVSFGCHQWNQEIVNSLEWFKTALTEAQYKKVRSAYDEIKFKSRKQRDPDMVVFFNIFMFRTLVNSQGFYVHDKEHIRYTASAIITNAIFNYGCRVLGMKEHINTIYSLQEDNIKAFEKPVDE
jgi:hypothetical protein